MMRHYFHQKLVFHSQRILCLWQRLYLNVFLGFMLIFITNILILWSSCKRKHILIHLSSTLFFLSRSSTLLIEENLHHSKNWLKNSLRRTDKKDAELCKLFFNWSCVECIWVLLYFVFFWIVFILGLGGLFGFPFLYYEYMKPYSTARGNQEPFSTFEKGWILSYQHTVLFLTWFWLLEEFLIILCARRKCLLTELLMVGFCVV